MTLQEDPDALAASGGEIEPPPQDLELDQRGEGGSSGMPGCWTSRCGYWGVGGLASKSQVLGPEGYRAPSGLIQLRGSPGIRNRVGDPPLLPPRRLSGGQSPP